MPDAFQPFRGLATDDGQRSKVCYSGRKISVSSARHENRSTASPRCPLRSRRSSQISLECSLKKCPIPGDRTRAPGPNTFEWKTRYIGVKRLALRLHWKAMPTSLLTIVTVSSKEIMPARELQRPRLSGSRLPCARSDTVSHPLYKPPQFLRAPNR